MRHYNEEKFKEKMETLSVEELNNFIMLRYWEKDEQIDDELENYLQLRTWKLKETFEWTEENREKLLRLDQKYIACWEKLREEARSLIPDLEKRRNEDDNFDFEIEAKIKSYISVPNENGEMTHVENCIEEIVFDALNDDNSSHYFVLNATLSSEFCLNDILYLDKEMNGGTDPWFNGLFDNEYISHSIHDLYSHNPFMSFQDILKINNLWAELKVVYQHSVDF
jgi:hypothetical protein